MARPVRSDEGAGTMKADTCKRLAAIACVVALAGGVPYVMALNRGEVTDSEREAHEILRRASDFHGQLQGMIVVATSVHRVEREEGPLQFPGALKVVMRRPNRMAMTLGAMSSSIIVVCDGKNVYTFTPAARRYAVSPAPAKVEELFLGDATLLSMLMERAGSTPAGPLLAEDPYQQLMKGARGASYEGIEDVDGTRCHHVHLTGYWEVRDIWIEAGEQPLVRRITTVSSIGPTPEEGQALDPSGPRQEKTVTFEKWVINPDLPDAVFSFRPPSLAREVDSLVGSGIWGPSPLLGEPAPQFQLELLDGGTMDMSAHRGEHVVILDFWATWCSPCRRGMPVLAEVAEAYKDKGVVVYAVNQGETPEKVRAYLEKTELKLTVALGKGSKVGDLYGVRGIPHTAIVGKDGTLQAVHVGFAPDLKERLTHELDTLLAGVSLVKRPQPEAEEE